MNMLNLPKKVYFEKGSMGVAFREFAEVYGFKRAFIISDANLYKNGALDSVEKLMRKKEIRTAEFFTLDEVPTFENVRSGLPKMLEFQPDIIIGIGGGSVMSAAKAMWLLYENPELDLEAVAAKYNTLAASDNDFPAVGKKAKLALMATTAATGAECSPFAVLADDKGNKCVIASYSLVPEMAVIDSVFSETVSAELAKNGGLTALSLAVRAYTAPGASEYTQGFAREAAESVLANLEAAVAGCPVAREKMATAAAIAGMAYGNAADTLDPDAGVYPTEAEKKDSNARIIDLAKHVGIDGASDAKVFAAWISACEKLASL